MNALVITALIISILWSLLNLVVAYENRRAIDLGLLRLKGLFYAPFLIMIFSAVWLIWG